MYFLSLCTLLVYTVEDKKLRVADPDPHQIHTQSGLVLFRIKSVLYALPLCVWFQSIIGVAKNLQVERRERRL